MSIGRLLHEFRPLFRLLEDPFTRAPTAYGLPNRSLLADPFFTSPIAIRPAVDLTEEGENYIVEAELPGVKKENVDITIGEGGRCVTIQGKTVSQRVADASESTGEAGTQPTAGSGSGAVANPETPSNQLTTERLYSGSSSFTRTVWLPRPVDHTKISAKLVDGILTLKAPKMEDRESVKINLE